MSINTKGIKFSALKSNTDGQKPVVILCPDGNAIKATPTNPDNYNQNKFVAKVLRELSNYLGNRGFLEVSSYSKGEGVLIKIITRNKP